MAYTDIDNPELYFQAKTYTGNSGTNAITFDGSENMQPDLVWTKARNYNDDHLLVDVVRGNTKYLKSHSTNAEQTSSIRVTSFNSNGFTLGSSSDINGNTDNYVSWNWKAGSGTATNSDGTVNTTVNVNQTAGFSIVSWTGNGNAAYLGHGLGANADWVLIKNRETSTLDGWFVNHNKVASTKTLFLNTTAAEATSSIYLNTAPDSTRFRFDSDQTVGHIAYCWKEVKGFSKFGSYTGNGNADGTFVYTGFRPAWVMIKSSSAGQDWHIHDNKRSTDNVSNQALLPNTSDSEITDTTVYGIDILSNGFKCRGTHNRVNGSGQTYIYMAFAESPFVNSKGIPTNAR